MFDPRNLCLLLQVDGNDMKTPGWRYNYWELKGVPLRVEVGPRDVEQGTCVLARRDMPGKLSAGYRHSCWLQLPGNFAKHVRTGHNLCTV
jgi:prolyl-tRNA synthetase